MLKIRKIILPGLLLCSLTVFVTDATAKRRANNFPTEPRVEYVFACMGTTNVSKIQLQKCICAIDEIASRISYADYQQAETILQIQQVNSPNAEAYKTPYMNARMEGFFRAQAGALLKCF